MPKFFAIVFFSLISGSFTGSSCATEAIRTFTPTSFSQIKATHAGKPFVVVVWSLDCAYCAESLAALAQVQRKRKMTVVSIATDRVDSDKTRDLMNHKLAEAGLGSEKWAFGPAPLEQLRYSIDRNWRGEMPRTYWFNTKGKSTSYSGVVTVKLAEKFL